MTTCLINNQTYYTANRSILNIEKLHDSGNYLKQNGEVPTRSWVVGPMYELLRFVNNKSHVILHVKSNAKKVNSLF